MSNLNVIILPNTYRDSVFLMKLSAEAKSESGAEQVSAMMGTTRNKALFVQSGLSNAEVENANADDLVVVIKASGDKISAASSAVKKLLEAAPAKKSGQVGQAAPKTVADACVIDSELNLALISVAGDYARYEAALCVNRGMDVVLYSDNVSIEDERALKTLAIQKGRLVMGPDCGTAIINGTPFAFANGARVGNVGIIGASGTGLQEVVCLLERFGVGISQAYGVGGRDLKDDIGGLTTLGALERLLADKETKFIGILAKPPGAKTRAKLLERLVAAKSSGKTIAVHYLGAENYDAEDKAGILHGKDLTDFSLLLAKLANKNVDEKAVLGKLEQPPKMKAGFLRGLFSGGTLCYESAYLSAPILGGNCYSNLGMKGFGELEATQKSQGHAFWDFGDDAFTVGRPHPMMAPELRMERLVTELQDPEVSVVFLDVVIGFGAAVNQAQTLVDALKKAETLSGGKSREKIVVAYVCGTDLDNPSRSAEVAILEKNGVIVGKSNAQAAVFAANAAKAG